MAQQRETFDKAVFLPDFPLDGPHLIEASAGTGKTHNIQNIYARLIMERNFRVSEIQVMTFTEAATKELRDRLHAVLKDVQGRFCVPPRDCPGKNAAAVALRNKRADALISCVPESDRGTARAGIELALLEFDDAAISTIHGFCRRVLNRYAFDTGVSLSSELKDRKRADLAALAEDWWRTRPAGLPEEVTLKALKEFVEKLSSKSEYVVEPGDSASASGILLTEADRIVKRYEADAPNRTAMNFDDLLRVLRDALKPERPYSGKLISRLRQEFKAALIDEFQDTDPVQYEIFERIFLDGNTGPLFFVGDPKQAIYSFRGGDIYTYLRAKGIPGLYAGSLGVNHRSAERLVDAVNGMFMDRTDGTSGEITYTFGDPRIGYRVPVTVEKPPETVKGDLLDRPLRVIEFPAKTKSQEIVDLLAEQVLSLLGERNEQGDPVYSPRDIAVLTNSNNRSAEVQSALRRRNIPGVIRRSGNVFASSVAREVQTFLLALANPSDKRLFLAAQSTVFGMGASGDLPDVNDPAAPEPFLESCMELNDLWQSRGLAAVIARLEGSGYREQLAQRPNGERHLADIGQIWELSLAAVKKIGPAQEAFLTWLADRIRGATANAFSGDDDTDERDTEEYARELESDEDAVRIMTIHVSKGLQFQVVLLPDCWHLADPRDPRNKVMPPAFHDDGGVLTFAFSGEAESRAKEELNLEKVRLLYVALTRAVERIILFTPPPETLGSGEPLPQLLRNLEIRSEGNPPYEKLSSEACHEDGTYVSLRQEDVPVPALPPPDFSGWSLRSKGSYSSLSPSMHGADSGDDDRDVDPWSGIPGSREEGTTLLPIFRIPEGAATGTCWHNILEHVPFDAGEPVIRRIARRELADSGLLTQEEYLRDTVEMIRKVLNCPLVSPSGERFALAQVPWSRRLSEQEFDFSTARAADSTRAIREILRKYWADDPEKSDFLTATELWDRPIPRGFMTGFIDLIFQHGDFYYVVDWKSNSLDRTAEAFDRAGVRREMAVHGYFFQYLLYAVVLHRYLKQTLGAGYAWEKNFGGIRYCFLRGIAAGSPEAVFADRPSEALLEELALALGLEA